MKPKEFSWKEDQQVTVTNPTPENFKFKVHSKDYAVGAGKTAKMPGYIAWVYVYALASKMAQDDNAFIHWNEEGFRNTYYDKIVVGADATVEEIVVEPEIETFDDEELEDDPTPPPAPSKSTSTQIKPMSAKKGK